MVAIKPSSPAKAVPLSIQNLRCKHSAVLGDQFFRSCNSVATPSTGIWSASHGVAEVEHVDEMSSKVLGTWTRPLSPGPLLQDWCGSIAETFKEKCIL